MEVFIIKKIYLFNRVSIISRLSMLLLLLGIILLFAGCSSSVKSTSQDKNITAIKTVLKHQFTGPDIDVVELLESPAELDQYYEKRYKSYFTENMYKSFIAANAYHYLFMAHNNGQQLKVDTVDVENIESTKSDYTFKVVVLIDKKGRNQKSAEVSGRVSFNKEGKITSIRNLDDGGLIKELRN